MLTERSPGSSDPPVRAMGSRGANPFWFHVLSSTLSHLIALALALLVYLLFLLWRDYVALLLSSFLSACSGLRPAPRENPGLGGARAGSRP